MKKSLCAAFVFMAAGIGVFPAALRTVNEEKDNIVITEEVLRGDPSAAAGVTLHIGANWEKHLFWDTAYAMGSGKEAGSSFSFSPEKVGTEWEQSRTARADFYWGAGFGSVRTEDGYGYVVLPEYLPYPDAIRAVAERTKAGEENTETVLIRDWHEYYPVDFSVEGSSVEYLGDSGQALRFLTELFRIPTAEDRLQISVTKNHDGEITSVHGQEVWPESDFLISGASAFREGGILYAWCRENIGTGRREDRGQNDGIYYLPYTEKDGWIQTELTRMRKLCDLPEDMVPERMLSEEETGTLYLTGRGDGECSLYVYDMRDETITLRQTVPLGLENPPANDEALDAREDGAWYPVPSVRRMIREEGGLLITRSDNSFAFVTEENGVCRLWCSGKFPDNTQATAGESPEMNREVWAYGGSEIPFPAEQACLFDGERLVLAAFENSRSLNVLVSVWDEEGEIYRGLYRHSGEEYACPEYFYGGFISPDGRGDMGYQADPLFGEWQMLTEPVRLTD